uniref:Uncharacterized protein n=1 Tax=Oryza punctata TaxID=4537 RepID=A0A0E0MEP7_ORYPU
MSSTAVAFGCINHNYPMYYSHLRTKDDELGRKGLEMEGLARSLKEAKAENKRLQAELDKGSEAKAEIERLRAVLKEE